MTAFTVPRKTAATVTTNGVAQAGHHNPVDATAAAVTLTLPSGANEGGSLSIAKTDSSSNAVTITPTLDGAQTLAYQGETLELIADSAGNWHTLSNNLPRGPLSATFLPKWQPSTPYTAGQYVLNPSGQIVSANAAFTSGTSYNSTQWTIATTASASDASTASKGIIQLAGDLSGTAAAPTVPGLANLAPLSTVPGPVVQGLSSATTAASANGTLIQNAINAAATAGGGTVTIPNGTWYTTPLVMKTRVRLTGLGWGSRLILAPSSNTHFVTLETVQTEQTAIENIWLDGNGANQIAGDIIHYDNTNYSQSQPAPSLGDPNHTMHRVVLWSAKEHGLHVIGLLGQGQYEKVLSYYSGKNAFRIEASDNQFISCIAAVSGWDNFFIGANSIHIINPKSWLAGHIDATQGSGYVISNVGRVTLVGAEAQDNRQHGYSVNSAYDCLIQGTADRNGLGPEPVTGGQGDGIYIGGSTRCMVDLVTGDRDTTAIMTRWAYNAGTGNDGNIVRISSGTTSTGVVGAGSFGANSDVITMYNDVLTKAPSRSMWGYQSPATYTLALSDAQTTIYYNASAAATITVPLNSAVAFPVGTIIEVFNNTANAISFTPTSGVTLHAARGYRLTAQYGLVRLMKRGTDEWAMVGDTAA